MLEVLDLSHSYGQLRVLDKVTFAAADGQFVALVGTNGCGKTTLLRLIAGLEHPTGGLIRLGGRTVTGPGPDRGFVFQEYALFPWLNVRQNVEYGLKMRDVSPEERRHSAQLYIDRMGLAGFESYRPDKLSGGMKQRAAIARALANDPSVLLMDEPFAALDCQTRTQMQDELQNVWDQDHKTVLFVTHNIEEAAVLADRVLIFSARPAHIVEYVDIDLPRPRNRTSPEINQLRVRIARALRVKP
jgi:NitT/TauT family transport system ATP-binding protein